MFDESDQKEWGTIVKTKAVKVHDPQHAALIRKRYNDRIVSSRMVRRWKPQEGTFAEPTAKSRWCVRGHQDPDTGSLQVYSLTPQTPSLHAFDSVGLAHVMEQVIADAKNAFCQSDKLKCPNGPIFFEPCEGLGLPKGSLIELVGPVYGLDDAPTNWHITLTNWLVSDGFRKHLFEPCWYCKHDKDGNLLEEVLFEVDDLWLQALKGRMAGLEQRIRSRVNFGKWKDLSAEDSDFAGRRIRPRGDKLLIDQEKYILEEIKPESLKKGRISDPESPLSVSEFAAYRHYAYKINWVGGQSRPEVTGAASILAGNMANPTVKDYASMLKACKHLRATASQCLTIWKMDLN